MQILIYFPDLLYAKEWSQTVTHRKGGQAY